MTVLSSVGRHGMLAGRTISTSGDVGDGTALLARLLGWLGGSGLSALLPVRCRVSDSHSCDGMMR